MTTTQPTSPAGGEQELLPCPFCGAGTMLIHENKGIWRGTEGYGEPISVEVRHWCKGEDGQPSPRLLAFVGKDRVSAIRRWNTRALSASKPAGSVDETGKVQLSHTEVLGFVLGRDSITAGEVQEILGIDLKTLESADHKQMRVLCELALTKKVGIAKPAGSVDVESVVEKTKQLFSYWWATQVMRHPVNRLDFIEVGCRKAWIAALTASGLLEEIERLKQELASKPEPGVEMSEERAVVIMRRQLHAELDYQQNNCPYYDIDCLSARAFRALSQHAEIRERGKV